MKELALHRRKYMVLLCLVAVSMVIVYIFFGDMHGQSVFLHLLGHFLRDAYLNSIKQDQKNINMNTNININNISDTTAKDAQSVQFRACAVVGADGIFSKVRQQLLDDELVYLGCVVILGIVETDIQKRCTHYLCFFALTAFVPTELLYAVL